MRHEAGRPGRKWAGAPSPAPTRCADELVAAGDGEGVDGGVVVRGFCGGDGGDDDVVDESH